MTWQISYVMFLSLPFSLVLYILKVSFDLIKVGWVDAHSGVVPLVCF